MYLDPDDIVNTDHYESIKEVAICDICTGIVWEPKQCSSCENTFCTTCFDAWQAKNDSCPFKCENFQMKDATRIVRTMISKLEFKCHTCGETVKYDDMKEHMDSCEETERVICPICGKENIQKELVDKYKDPETEDQARKLKKSIAVIEAEIRGMQDRPSNIDNTFQIEQLFNENLKLQDELRSLEKQVKALHRQERAKVSGSSNPNEVEYVGYEFSGEYTYKGRTAGTNNLEDLLDNDLSKGICCNSPGWLIIELSKEVQVVCIDVAGWDGDPKLWAVVNGAHAEIFTSLDKEEWQLVGKVPGNFGKAIIRVNLNPSTAKYIRFNNRTFLGLGYLNINSQQKLNIKGQFASFVSSGPYIYKGKMAGNNNLEDLDDKDLKKKGGICAASPGQITITLSKMLTFNALEIGGYSGDSVLWYSENGAGAEILVSLDNKEFRKIGNIPRGFGSEIKRVSFEATNAKYLRFNHTSYLGIGYLRLNETSGSHGILLTDIYEDFEVVSGFYTFKGKTAGTNHLNDLLDSNGKTGICANAPGCIVITLTKPTRFSSIEVSGWDGDNALWAVSNGSRAKVLVSMDRSSWTSVGILPSLSRNKQTMNFAEVRAKFIRVEHPSYLGFGVFRVIPTEQIGNEPELGSFGTSKAKPISFQMNRQYRSDVGDSKIDSVIDRSLNTGLCAAAPGWIIFELERTVNVKTIELGGFCGNLKMWHPTQGVNSEVMTSKDRINWTKVGNIPKNYGSSVISFDVAPTLCRYVKFVSKGFLGIGFFAVH